MLKFTKYGRKASTGSFAIHALQTANATVQSSDDSKKATAKLPPDPELSSFRKIGNDEETGKKSGQAQMEPGKGIFRATKDVDRQVPTTKSNDEDEAKTNFDINHNRLPPQRHLSFSKVPREELLLLNSSLEKNPEGGIEYPKKVKRVHFSASTLDAYEKKENERRLGIVPHKTSRTSLHPVGKIKVPVYNDDYFPRIQRIKVHQFSEAGKAKHGLKFKIFKI